MNSKYIKLLIVSVILLIGINVNAEVNTKNYIVLIEDDTQLLTETQKIQLRKQMTELTKYGNIAFKSINTSSNSNIANYAQNYYYQKFQNESGSLLVVDIDKRNIYIFSTGVNNSTTNNTKEKITNKIYKCTTNENYYDCVKNAYIQMEQIIERGKIHGPMRYISNAIIAIVISLFINYLIVLATTKKKTTSNKELLDNCDIHFEISNIKSQKNGTRKTFSPRNYG